jgi:multidrug efflux pump subunit AcrA (membrane-fusion protein)
MQENKRKIIRASVIIAAAFLLVKLIMSFKQDNSINKLTESIKLISTELVKLSSNTIMVPVSGKLQAINEVNIVSEGNGIFYGNQFKSGIKFKKGDTLGYIKYNELENNLNSQKSNLLNEVSRLVSEIKFDYPESYNVWLNFMNGIHFNKPLPDLPKIESEKFRNYLSGKNFYTSFYSTKAIEEKINKHIITCDFDGVLNEVSIKSGTPVVFGQKIGKIQDPSKLEFEASTNIQNTLMISENQSVEIKSDELIGIWKGAISRINKTIDPSSQNMSVFIKTSNKNLYSGMYVYGNILIGENNDSYSIKRSLLNNNKIFLIIENKLIEKEIEILQISEEDVIIKGLKNGDEILSEPIKGSFSGMEIRTKKK